MTIDKVRGERTHLGNDRRSLNPTPSLRDSHRGTSREEAILKLQRLAGNKAVTSLLQSTRTSNSGSLTVQRHPGDPGHTHPDPFAKKKHGRAQRAWMFFARPIRTTFSPDPQSRQTKETPKVSEDERVELNRIMDEAVRFRDQRKKDLIEHSFLPEEEAERQANTEAFGDLPESYRPRNITPSERQRITNQKAFTEENVKKQQLGQTKEELTRQGASKEQTKQQRETDFKFSLGPMGPDEVATTKTTHEQQKTARTQQKAALKTQWEKQDAQEEKTFEKHLKSLTKEQQGAAKSLQKTKVAKRKQQRKLTLFMEEIKEYPEQEREVKIANFKKKNGMPESLGTEDADLASTGLGLGSKLSSTGGELASLSSDITSVSSIGGTSMTGTVSLPSGGTEQVKLTSGGTANQGSDILGAASDLTGLGQEISALVSAFKTKSGGNPAQQELADDQIVDNTLNVGQTTASLGEDANYLVEAFGKSSQGLESAGAMPIFDLIMNIQRLIQNGKHLAENARRISKQGKLKEFSKKHDFEVMKLGLQMSYGRGAHLVAHYTFDTVATGLRIAGDIVTLTGVGAAPGQATKLAGTVLGATNKVARQVADSYLGGKTLEARRGAQLAKPGSSEDLMRFDPKHASQAFISRARGGDLLALKTLATFGIDKEMLAKSDDASLRQLILGKLELSEEPKTLLGSAGEGIKKVWGKLKQFGSGMRNLHLKEKEIEDLRKVKNELRYGGKGDRDVHWKSKMRFHSYDEVVAQKSRLAKAIVASDLDQSAKDRLLPYTMTTREKEEQAKHDRKAKELADLKVGSPKLKKANLKQPLETMSQTQLEEVFSSDLSDPDDAKLAVNIWADREFSQVLKDT